MDPKEGKRFSNLVRLFTREKPKVGVTPADVVHSENKWRLLRYRGAPNNKTPIVLVPSLINRHYVLDLMPGKSFAEQMVREGFDVFCIDWGTPGDEDRYLSFDDIVDGYVGRALKVASRLAGTPNAHVLGYCMGGTMAAIHAAAHPERFASLTAVAAPIRFEDDGLLSRWSRTNTFDVGVMTSAYGNVPWQLMQGAFQLLRPTLQLAKAVGMIHRAWDDEFLDGFLALETWGQDAVSFPGEAYRRYIEDLYRGDLFINDRFTLSGAPARLASITCPTLAITFEHDNIVPWQSAKVLVDRVGAEDTDWLHIQGGHVGAMISRAASKNLWPKIGAFWRHHEPVSRASRPPAAKAVSARKRA